ncbi:MAG: hypothetical protein O6852_08215 [Gammaproteobacteria bacterium]|nr:hypothetical protein [Gammaproteobacteria bacterium]
MGLVTRFQILRYESITEFPSAAGFQIPSKLPDNTEQLIEVPSK